MDYKAFVSSTFVDLKEHRAHVIGELRKSGFFVDPMEEWTGAVQEPKVLSVNRLDGCKLCILLVARRRGHVPDGEVLSITQQEVAEAQRRPGTDVLTFLLDDGVVETDWPWDADQRPDVEAWRNDLCEHAVVSTFTKDPKSVALSPALARWVKDKGAEVALDLYLKLVEQEHGTIQFVGLPQLKDNPNAPINRLYVEPALSERQVSPDTDPKEWPTTTQVLDVMVKDIMVESEPIPNLVRNEMRLVVLGDPGSGKSTMVSWIAWQLAKHHHDGSCPWTERLGPLIPLPFVLRNLNIGKGVTWDTLLRAFLDQPIAKLLDMADLQKILDEGRAFIMLDGLDEIGNPAVRRDLRDAVWAAFKKYPKSRWLLTSRVVGYEELRFETNLHPPHKGRDSRTSRLGLRSYQAGLRYVAPFDDARVDQFADNWFTLREDAEWKRQQLSKEFVKAVRAHDSTMKLGRIPNLLTLMAMIYRNGADLPHGRARLYAKIAQAYLETIDNWRKLQRTTEDWTDRRRWLARVGFEMQRGRSVEELNRDPKKLSEGKEILATGAQVRQWVAAAMAESGKEGSDEDAAGFVDYLAKRSGLLLPRGQDQFAFLHLSFQEYFAAVYFAQKIVTPAWLKGDPTKIPEGARRSDLERCANQSVWRETLIFLVELLASENQDWLSEVRNCLFGDNFAALAVPLDTTTGKIASSFDPHANDDRAALLARLAIDPQAGFDTEEKLAAIKACCHWDVAHLQGGLGNTNFLTRQLLYSNAVTRVLLSSEKNERQENFDCLLVAAQVMGVTLLDLSGTSVSDVAPLKGLTALTELGLNGTSVSDVSPLKGLTALTWLDLSGTSVSDVSPLNGLTALTGLGLNGTTVSDVSPLKGLTALTTLDLSGTSVSDVSALKGLTALTLLDLRGTSVSDVSALQMIPGLKIYGVEQPRSQPVAKP